MSGFETNSSSPCYQFEDNQIHQGTNWLPCGPWKKGGPVLSCCKLSDYCMTNGICHYTHNLQGGSGYYQGSCTDSQYENDLCPHLCNDQVYPDVKYNKTLASWQCCGVTDAGDVSCDAPTTNEFFNAPVPVKLVTTATAGQTVLPSSPSSSTSRTQTTSAKNSPSKASATQHSSSTSGTSSATSAPTTISGGAIAGIVIGALFVLAALAALIWFLLRRRKRRREAGAPKELAANEPASNNTAPVQEYYKYGPVTSGEQQQQQQQHGPAEADSVQFHELAQPQEKMYYDYTQQQWMFRQDNAPRLTRQPMELSADQVPRAGMQRAPTELSADSRPAETHGPQR